MPFGSSRRELLGALLGLPFASTLGCRVERARRLDFDGELLGPDMAAGHLLRSEFRPDRPDPDEERTIPVLILGAGVAGLAAAWELTRSGLRDFRVLELEGAPGGTSLAGRRDGLSFPWAAHYLPVPGRDQPDLLDLLKETGSLIGMDDQGRPIYDEEQLCAAPKERLYQAGFWHEGLYPGVGASAEDLADLTAFRAEVQRFVGMRDASGRRAFAIPIDRSSDDPALRALDGESFADWLDRKNLRSRRLRWYVEYGCRDDFGTELAETSAWAGLHYFASRTEEPGEDSAEYLTWPEGNAFLIDHFVRRIGAERVEPRSLVVSVGPDPASDGRRAVVLTFDPSTRRTTRWTADRVIFALPSFLRRYLLAGFGVEQTWAPATAPWVVANVHLRDHPGYRGFEQAWDNVIYGSRSLGYVVATHQLHTTRGRTVWTWYLPLSGRDEKTSRAEILSLTWEDAVQPIVAELSRCHAGFIEKVERIDVMRWPHAMPRPTPGTIWTPARANAARPLGPVHFAHTDLSALALFEEAFAHGVRAAREVSSTKG